MASRYPCGTQDSKNVKRLNTHPFFEALLMSFFMYVGMYCESSPLVVVSVFLSGLRLVSFGFVFEYLSGFVLTLFQDLLHPCF